MTTLIPLPMTDAPTYCYPGWPRLPHPGTIILMISAIINHCNRNPCLQVRTSMSHSEVQHFGVSKRFNASQNN